MNVSEEIKRTLLLSQLKQLTQKVDFGSPKYMSLLKAREVVIKQLIEQHEKEQQKMPPYLQIIE